MMSLKESRIKIAHYEFRLIFECIHEKVKYLGWLEISKFQNLMRKYEIEGKLYSDMFEQFIHGKLQ